MAEPARWQLYKLLAEPIRLRLLFLAGCEELSIGELADLLGEPQPNVSKQLAVLRRSDLLSVRKQGTRVFVRRDGRWADDAVISDAVQTGRRLCAEDGSLARLPDLLQARDADARAFFAQQEESDLDRLPDELPAYLSALAPLMPERRLAVDVGTGGGNLLDVLAPIYERVIAVDREGAQLSRARARAERRGYRNIEWVEADFDAPELHRRVDRGGGASVVVAARFLHHVPKPVAAIRRLAELVAPGGHLIIIDYASHQDERMGQAQADVWLGFEADELVGFAREAGFSNADVFPLPASRCGTGPDGHLDWLALIARADGVSQLAKETKSS